jgi:hypothetical protein
MAQSSCPKCGHHSFEIAEAIISGAKFKHYYVQCAKYGCGTVVGLIDYNHTGTMINEVKEEIKKIRLPSSSNFEQVTSNNIALLFQNVGAVNKKLDKMLALLEKKEGDSTTD